jgi:hypothetical protein
MGGSPTSAAKRSASAERPRPARFAVQQGQCAPDLRVAHARKPAFALWRQTLDVAAHRFHEHELGQLGEDGIGARPRGRGFAHAHPQQFAQQRRCRPVADRDAQHARQGIEQRAAHAAAAGEIAAHEARGRAAAAVTHLDQVVGRGIRTDQTGRLHGRELQVATHQVLVSLRKHDQIAGRHIEHFHAVGQPQLAAAFGKEVEEHHVFGGKPCPDARQAEFRLHAPGRGELRVDVDGAFKAQRLENVRQSIHGVSGKKRGVSAKSRCGTARILPLVAPESSHPLH